MISLNRAAILGRLTRDPEMRYTPNGRAVANFGVATNRRYKTAEGATQDQTEFHDIVAWSKLAEIANQMLHKGDPVYIEGRLQTRSWEAPDGAKRQKTEIVAESIIALGARTANATMAAEAIADSEVPGEPLPADGDKPDKKSSKKSQKPAEAKKDETPGSEINLDDLPF